VNKVERDERLFPFTAFPMSILIVFLVACVGLVSDTNQAQIPTVAEAQAENDEAPPGFDDESPAPRKVSNLVWIYKSLGIRYSVLLGGSSLLTFVGAVMIVRAARQPAPLAAYMLIVAIPTIIGVVGGLDGMIITFSVLADPQPHHYWGGLAQAIVAPLVGILLTAPSYLLVSAALVLRTLRPAA
jgi:hypothetical protein